MGTGICEAKAVGIRKALLVVEPGILVAMQHESEEKGVHDVTTTSNGMISSSNTGKQKWHGTKQNGKCNHFQKDQS